MVRDIFFNILNNQSYHHHLSSFIWPGYNILENVTYDHNHYLEQIWWNLFRIKSQQRKPTLCNILYVQKVILCHAGCHLLGLPCCLAFWILGFKSSELNLSDSCKTIQRIAYEHDGDIQ